MHEQNTLSSPEAEQSEWGQTILGEPASKANSRRLVYVGRKPRVIKSKKALEYSQIFEEQVKPPNVPIDGDVRLDITIWYKTRRPDLDPSLIMDLLQKVGVIHNDRQIKEIHAIHRIDRENPRSSMKITKILEDLE